MSEPGERATAVVVAGGVSLPGRLVADLVAWPPAGAFVIAADSGVDHALALGWDVDLAIGDFDSVSPAGLEAVTRAGARVERHPPAKDATDLELALDAALAHGAERDRRGGRARRPPRPPPGRRCCCSPSDAYADVDGAGGDRRRPGCTWCARPSRSPARSGDLVTLLAVGGPAHGVTTDGLRYPLAGETLTPGSTRGVSNELTAPVASVSLTAGVVLAIQPTADPPTIDPPTDPPTDP